MLNPSGWFFFAQPAPSHLASLARLQAYVHPRLGLVLNMIINALHQFHMYGDEPLKVDYLVQFGPEELSEPAGDEPTAEPGRKRRVLCFIFKTLYLSHVVLCPCEPHSRSQCPPPPLS